MALLRYFKKRDGLPDPKGSLSHTIPSRAISMANSEVTEATTVLQKIPPGMGSQALLEVDRLNTFALR